MSRSGGPTRNGKSVQSLYCLALLALLAPSPSFAQEDDEWTGPHGGATVDTTLGRGVFGLGIHPRYVSRYDVNRTATAWTNSVDLARTLGSVSTMNRWSVKVEKDEARNGYKLQSGTAAAEVAYETEQLGGWSSGTNFNMGRRFSRTNVSRLVSNNHDLSVFLTSGAIGAAVRNLFGTSDSSRAFSWDVTGRTGLTGVTDVREQGARGTGASAPRADSTDADGLSHGLESRLHAEAGSAWTLDLSGNVLRTREDSRTESTKPVGADSVAVTITEVPNRNRSERASLTSVWKPTRRLDLRTTSSYTNTFRELFSTAIHARDVEQGQDKSLRVDVKTKPFWGLDVSLGGTNRLFDKRQDVDTGQNSGQSERSLNTGLVFSSGSPFGPLSRIESTTTWDTSEIEHSSGRSADYTERRQNFKQGLKRQLGSEIVLLLNGEGVINQTFYADSILDQDELRWSADGTFGYRPSGNRTDLKLSAKWTERETVNIHTSKSNNNITETSYYILFDYTYKLRPAIKLNQTYTITATSSEYLFNRTSNGLVRGSEVRTKFDGLVGTRVRLALDHQFRSKNSGSYLRRIGSTLRTYSRAQEEAYQNFLVTTTYTLARQLELHSSQRFEVRKSTVLATKRETKTERLEFTAGMSLAHQFGDSFLLDLKADHTESDSDRPYWRVVAAVNRTF